ncbi:MAG: hypothetical protein ACQEQV_05475 [Fibrobacterota bacterium]
MASEVVTDNDGDETDTDIKDDIKAVDFGIAMGGGLGIPAGSGKILLDLRYTLGLTEVNDTDFDVDAKNGAFGAMVGYGIDF